MGRPMLPSSVAVHWIMSGMCVTEEAETYARKKDMQGVKRCLKLINGALHLAAGALEGVPIRAASR